MERPLSIISPSEAWHIQNPQRKVHRQGRSIQVGWERPRRLGKFRLGPYNYGIIGIWFPISRMNLTWVKALSTTESCLFGEIKQILVLWWTTLRKWTFSMLKISFSFFLTGKRFQKEAKRPSQVTKASWTSLSSIGILHKTQIRRKLKIWSKKIIKQVKFKK